MNGELRRNSAVNIKKKNVTPMQKDKDRSRTASPDLGNVAKKQKPSK